MSSTYFLKNVLKFVHKGIDNALTLGYNGIRNKGNGPTEKEIKTMSKNELVSRIESLREWENILEEAQQEVEALKDSLKAELTERGVEELEAGQYIIRYTNVLSNRFDSSAFKKIYGDLYKAFTKQISSKRFSVA